MKRLSLGLLLATVVVAAVPAAGLADDALFTRKQDVIYGRKYGVALTMDVFTPSKNANGAAVVFAVSGGWVSRHDAIQPALVTEFLKRGYTVFAVCHGCQPKFTIPEILEDMHRAVRFIRHHAKEYGVDPERFAMTGGSAGGHLSLMLGTTGGPGDPKATDPVDRVSSRLQCVGCFFPPTDFLNFGKTGVVMNTRTMRPQFRAAADFHEMDKDTRLFQRITDEARERAILQQISPVSHVTQDDAPTLIIHGDKDDLVPLQQSELFLTRLKEVNVAGELVVKKGAGHGWATLPFDIATLADWFDKHLTKKAN